MIEARLRAVVARVPERTAIVFGHRRIGYRELGDRVTGFSAGLRSLGVGPGDRVLLVLPNSPEFVIGYFATAGLRATVLALDPELTKAEFLDRLREYEPAVIITDAPRAAFLEALAGRTAAPPRLVVVGPPSSGERTHPDFDSLTATVADAPAEAAPAPYDGPWVITHSSGSTGEPKRILRSQGNQLAEADHIISTAAITPQDVVLCPVPLFHALGQFCCMIVSVLAGATLVLVDQDTERPDEGPASLDVGRVLTLLREHRVTVFPSVPYLLGALADWPADQEADLSSVRLCLSGSNFLPADVRDRFTARFGLPVRQTYGSSEAGSVAWDCDPDAVVPDSVGRPLNGVTVEIVDTDGRVLPSGETGEVAVTSAAVMTGYVGEAAEPGAGSPPRRRHLTGDLGRLDPDGRLHITGRKRILIDTGGRKVNPVEVEAVLEQHPGVTTAAVVGVPLRGGGDLLVAAVVPNGTEQDTDRLAAFCRERLAGYKVPGVFTFVDEIPRTPLGKIRRSQLADRLTADTPGTRPAPEAAAVHHEPDPAARTRLVTGHLLRHIALITGADPGELDPELAPHTLGLDSLGALRLKMAVQDELQRTIGLPRLLDGTTVEAIAAELARSAPDDGPAEPPVVRGGATGEFPLSANQRAIWNADQLAPESAAYNQVFAARLADDCDVDALRRAFQGLTDRHSVLRSTFRLRGGQVQQRVADHAVVDFQVVEAPLAPEREEEVLGAEAFRQFALETERPLRVRLFTGARGGPVLLVTVHHIITDFWSTVVMLRDLAAGYAAETTGAEVYRPSPAHTYTDYTRWHREWLEGPGGQQDWEYWREVLRDPPPGLELPLDKPRPAVPSQRGATLFHDLAPDSVKELQTFARVHGTTVYTVLLAVFHTLLHSCTAERDIAVAAITTNRRRNEFRHVLGFFANPVVCRVSVDPREPFRELLDRVRSTLLIGLEHQLLPFETVVERLGLRRSPARAPLVEVAFGQNKAQDGELAAVSRFLSGGSGQVLRLGPLSLESVALRRRGTVYDLSGAVYEAEDSLAIAWEYNTDLFEEATVARLAERFEHVLRAVLEDPGQPVGEIGVTERGERAALLAASCGEPARSQPVSVPVMVARQAQERPDAVAVVTPAGRLDRAVLTARAARLADRVRAVRPEPGAVAALWLPADSTASAVAGLGTLMASVTCDPVDADAPAEHVASAVAEGRIQLVVTDRAARDRLGPVGVPVLCVDDGPDDDAAPVVEDVPGATSALVLRGSGVTGTARARLLNHRTLAAWAAWTSERYGPLHGDVLLHGALRPDRRLAALLAVIAAGGTAVLTPKGTTPGSLAELLTSDREFALVRLTPTELALLLPALAASGRRPRVAALAVAGERLPGSLVRRWRELAGPTRIVHEYGGADTVPVVSAYEVPLDLADDGPVSCGRPVPGVDRRVLGPSGALCPVGVVGEICVGEASVAGPFGREEIPAERFVTACPEEGGERLYRTGDLGRYLPDGDVVVLGRADARTTVRGYLADPSITAEALMALPDVAHAAVVAAPPDDEARPASSGGSEEPRGRLDGGLLVARVVPYRTAAGNPPTPASLRERLRRVLPEYLVPTEFLVADEPTPTGNGKAAHTAQAVRLAPASLPVSDVPPLPTASADETVAVSPPAEGTEAGGWPLTRLAVIWADVLGVASVEPDDDYFDLDGDSITSLRIVSRAADEGILITPRQLFTNPVLRDLAAVAEVVAPASAQAPAQRAPEPEAGPVPLTPVQRWFLELRLPEASHWNQAVALRTRGPADRTLLADAVRAVAAHHPVFRHRFTGSGADTAQILDPAAVPVRVVEYEDPADQAHDGEGMRAVAAGLHTSLDLAHGPLLAVAILPAGPGGEVDVLLCAHHLVIDFVSWQILVNELARTYEQLRAGETVRLPATTPYAHWARALREHAASAAVRAELDHWAPPGGAAPVASAALVPAVSRERDAGVSVAELSVRDTAALLGRSDGPGGVRVQDVLLAAVAYAVAEWSGRREVRIDLEGHGRGELAEVLDLTRAVGWFTTMYPVAVGLPPGRPPVEAFHSVRDTLREVPHDGLGHGLLRYTSDDPAVRERLAALPPSPVNFTYLGRMGELLDGGGRSLCDQEVFTAVPLPEGGDRGPDNPRPYALEISAMLTGGRVRLRVVHGASDPWPRPVDDLVASALRAVREIVAGLAEDRT
ncbi:condensation domain-containing protein [Streptomyces griseoruber]|uniref:condensation domain-containing protein n=1 Tax=Streptomyces griseoruber TaxID=1943 RepID=UPI0006E19441|nr:condensation domain-containing protein [Streptomyces griseoruber]